MTAIPFAIVAAIGLGATVYAGGLVAGVILAMWAGVRLFGVGTRL